MASANNDIKHVIAVSSGKGGVGKTTFTANIASKLAKRGLRVCMIDLDLGLNNLDVIMGLENKVVFDVVDAVTQDSNRR